MKELTVVAAVDAQGRLLGFRRYNRIVARRLSASVSHGPAAAARAIEGARRGWPSLRFETQPWNPGRAPDGCAPAPIPIEVNVRAPAPREEEEVELFDADPACRHETRSLAGGGLKCAKCPGWFCF